MIKKKLKKCRGSGKAKGCGCGEMKFIHKYGLCTTCFCEWLYNTPEGKETLQKTTIRAKKKVEKESKPKRKYIKWQEKPTNEMMIYVQEQIVNPYIRLRDYENFKRCIASGGVIEHAGHCFSVGSTPGLRFNIMNIHGQAHYSNTHKHGDFVNYRIGLINRHGEGYFNELSRLKIKADRDKTLDRLEVIRIGKTYEYLLKNEIWCFTHTEFENYKNIINK